ncbi:MAG: hypothetical protein ACI8XM_001427 [Haloarculaceae archaeon]|jgi:hypothetical protein
MDDAIPVRVVTGGEETTIDVEPGANLRDALLGHDLPVYRLSRPSASGSYGNRRFP